MWKVCIAAVLLSGCAWEADDCRDGTCGVPAPPLTVDVWGAIDAAVTVTRVDGVTAVTTCVSSSSAVGDRTYCQVEVAEGRAPGVYRVRVTAPGFQPAAADVTVEATPPGGCCNPGYFDETLTIPLVPS